jgi:hypothetical protein
VKRRVLKEKSDRKQNSKMNNILRLFADPAFIAIWSKYINGNRISRLELKAIIEGCKARHNSDLLMSGLEQEDKLRLIDKYCRLADAVAEYTEDRLKVEGKLEE